MKDVIYCEKCEGFSDYAEYYEDMRDGTKVKVIECKDCETVYPQYNRS